MAVSQLIVTVDKAGASILVRLLIVPGVRPVLHATNAVSLDELFVSSLPDVVGYWVWKINTVADQVLLLRLDDVPDVKPVLISNRARIVLAKFLKAGLSPELATIRIYHALTLLLFSEGDYAETERHLELLKDLSCDC